MKIRSHHSRRSKGVNLSSASRPLPKRLTPFLGLLRVPAVDQGGVGEVIELYREQSATMSYLKLHRGLQDDPGHASLAWIANKPLMVVENAMPARADIAAGPKAWSRDRARDERTRTPIIGVAVSAPMTQLSGARTPGSLTLVSVLEQT